MVVGPARNPILFCSFVLIVKFYSFLGVQIVRYLASQGRVECVPCQEYLCLQNYSATKNLKLN